MNNIDYKLLFMDTFTAITCNVPVCGIFKLSTKHTSSLLYSIAENDKDIAVYINDKKKGIRLIGTVSLDVCTQLGIRTLKNIQHFVGCGKVSIETFTYHL